MNHLFYLLVVLMCVYSQVKGENVRSGEFGDEENGYRKESDITYKSVDGQNLVLDFYFPMQREEQSPLIIFFHGGGWIKGSKNALEQTENRLALLRALVDNGFVVATVGYRLAGEESHLDNAIADCKDAIRWCRNQANVYGVDSSRIGIWGASAGGHLALMAAMAPDEEFLGVYQGTTKVDYVINHFAPTDLVSLLRLDINKLQELGLRTFERKLYKLRKKIITALFDEEAYDNKKELIQYSNQLSPIYHVTDNLPPMLILHGDKDKIVPIDQSYELYGKIKDAKGSAIMSVYPLGHGFVGMEKDTLKRLELEMLKFIDRVYQSQ